MPGYPTHAARDNRDRRVGLFAPLLLPSIQSSEIRTVADRNPGRLDEPPFDPLVAAHQHAAMPGLAAGPAFTGVWSR